MSPPNVEVVANDVGHLTDRVEKLEAKVEARIEKLEAKVEAGMMLDQWKMGAAVGFGVVMTLLLPRISAVLGLS